MNFGSLIRLLSIDNHSRVTVHLAHVTAAVDVAEHLGALLDEDLRVARDGGIQAAAKDVVYCGVLDVDFGIIIG